MRVAPALATPRLARSGLWGSAGQAPVKARAVVFLKTRLVARAQEAQFILVDAERNTSAPAFDGGTRTDFPSRSSAARHWRSRPNARGSEAENAPLSGSPRACPGRMPGKLPPGHHRPSQPRRFHRIPPPCGSIVSAPSASEPGHADRAISLGFSRAQPRGRARTR